jgi:threonine dehydrogenase-like Zn-dependent dehydrogenase
MAAARASMKALVLRDRATALEEIAAPVCEQPDDVVVGVAVAGVCRTDCYLATGQIAVTTAVMTPAAAPLVLGHELAGVVREAGPASGFEPGERVACMPLLGCGQCAACRAGRAHVCPHGRMLGLDRDGGFAERVLVPASALVRVPAGLSLRHAAFAEPVAAALAVPEALNDMPGAGTARAGRGVILGQGRIAVLTTRVLAAAGFGAVPVRPVSERVDASDAGAFDFVVETTASERAFAAALALLRPRGTLVLKSRPPRPVPLDVVGCVRKELRLAGAYYGSLAEALHLMHTGAIAVDDLLGPGHALADHQAVFTAELAGDEARKQFFVLGD